MVVHLVLLAHYLLCEAVRIACVFRLGTACVCWCSCTASLCWCSDLALPANVGAQTWHCSDLALPAYVGAQTWHCSDLALLRFGTACVCWCSDLALLRLGTACLGWCSDLALPAYVAVFDASALTKVRQQAAHLFRQLAHTA
jgi:hypothetical protein